MCRQDTTCRGQSHDDESSSSSCTKPPSTWRLWVFASLLVLDAAASAALLAPMLPLVRRYEAPSTGHYTLYGSLWDLFLLTVLRILSAIYAIVRLYLSDTVPSESPFDLYHRNGDRKTSEELDEEALEEPCCPWFRRYIARPAFPCEVSCLVSGILVIVKCLARLNVELLVDSTKPHALFWLALCFVAVVVVLESVCIDQVAKIAGDYGRHARRQTTRNVQQWTQHTDLCTPLLADDTDVEEGRVEQEGDADGNATNNDGVRAVSDITGDSKYKAGWADLIALCYQDSHLIALAFVFLLGAAIAQVYIPRFTGNILDALAETFSHNDDDHRGSMWNVPGFVSNVEKLVVASILGGVFSGIRGSIFTVVGGRVNVRLRVLLMDSLLSQDIGFFDMTKTGDITSRLTSDTTLVGDQVQLNVNVFLRSLVQAIGVLVFMFLISWRLSLLAFISVPVITVLSKWYGNFVRSLTKLMQKKLADGNSTSEAALGSMPTVRSFDAADSELKEFEECMKKYLWLNMRAAFAYCGYATCVTALPQLVIALVLYYGGLLVRNGDITSGQLVSFLLYLSSLSDAFGSIGYIFSSMTQAVGAADKVFELIHRKPRVTPPSSSISTDETPAETARGFLGIEKKRTAWQRSQGLHPEKCSGEITLDNVELFYPARPQRRVLHGLTMQVPPGAVVALVGPSGSGKSSVMSLVQHLYEPSAGEIRIDGSKVHNLSPQWLSRNISVVSQEPTLFARSVRRNIIYGLEGADDEPTEDEIQEAARLANASSFIEKLPFGYETDVGERGVQLSGGQKQRIAIARALVRQPRILLLDEATSALDAESEALVQEAIDDMLSRGRGCGSADDSSSMTVLIVAHRLSTVRNADIIFVVQDGKVVEQGSHDGLLQNPYGAYAALIKRQMKAQKQLDA